MTQSNRTSPHPARSRRSAGRAQLDPILDPYQRASKLPEGTVCPQCGAVYRRGRWQWAAAAAAANRETCPACRRIAEHLPAGVVTVTGSLSAERWDELLRLARHEADAEQSEHPLNRIVDIERAPDGVVINTTDIHLPRRIGAALERAFHAKCDMHFDEHGYFARVTCAIGAA